MRNPRTGSSASSISPSRTASFARPCGTICPRSRSKLLIWFISEVRSPTSWSRIRCSVCMSNCSWLFSSTNRIVGRVAASAIASASRSSFFWAFTYGRTYSGDINRTVCPCATSARPIWWAPQQASIATTHGASDPAKAMTVSRSIPRTETSMRDAPTPRCSDPLPPRSHILFVCMSAVPLSGCGLLRRSELGRRRWRRPSWIRRE